MYLTKRGFYEGFFETLLQYGVSPEDTQRLVKQAEVPWGTVGAGAAGLAAGGLGGYALGRMGVGAGEPEAPEPGPEMGMGGGGMGPQMGGMGPQMGGQQMGGGMQLTPEEMMYLEAMMQQQAAPQYDPYVPYAVY